MLQPVSTIERHDWTKVQITSLFMLPLHDLLHMAQTVHRTYFDPNQVQLCTLMNIKSGGCPEDCAYCPQSARYKTGVETNSLPSLEEVDAESKKARANGATRLCMGAAWRSPREKDFAKVLELIGVVKENGMESCATLGMLSKDQARRLKEAGLQYYNHNIDTSPEFYGKIISTRTFADRLQTLQHVRDVGMSVCCGGIVGMGESRLDRISMLHVLSTMPQHPESVPINQLVKVPGTPLESAPDTDSFEIVRTIAVARIIMPKSHVRLAAGREQMSEEIQMLCFHAGANSIFSGEKLLTTGNPELERDRDMMQRAGMHSSN